VKEDIPEYSKRATIMQTGMLAPIASQPDLRSGIPNGGPMVEDEKEIDFGKIPSFETLQIQ
jgi:hypothetical protein